MIRRRYNCRYLWKHERAISSAEKEVLMAYEITDKNIDKILMILDEITQ